MRTVLSRRGAKSSSRRVRVLYSRSMVFSASGSAVRRTGVSSNDRCARGRPQATSASNDAAVGPQREVDAGPPAAADASAASNAAPHGARGFPRPRRRAAGRLRRAWRPVRAAVAAIPLFRREAGGKGQRRRRRLHGQSLHILILNRNAPEQRLAWRQSCSICAFKRVRRLERPLVAEPLHEVEP